MSVNRRKLASWALAAALAGAGAAAGAQDRPTYRFSPVNQYDLNLTAAYWNPIIAYVSDKSGVNLVLRIGRTSADTTSYVLTKEVEFVFTNHLFSPEREKLGWKVFGRRQLPPIHAAIAVMDDSPVKQLSDLQGQEVAFAGPEALVGYKMTYAHLLSQKVDVKVVFGGNQNGAMAQLVAGKAKAVGGNSQLIDGYAEREGKKLRTLWKSGPLYDLALMASGSVPAKDLKAVSDAFFSMHKDPKGREILHQASQQVGLTADAYFIASDGKEYDAFRRFYETAPPNLR